MNRKILSLVLVIIGVVNLVGCQLAKIESEYQDSENICGVFITYHEDEEDYDYSDDIDKKYYGNFDENLSDKDIDKYDFDGLDGNAIFLHEEGEGEDKVKGALSDNIFQDIHLSVNVNSEEDGREVFADEEYESNITSEEYEITATIYVTSKFKGIIQFNPIIRENKKYYTILQGNSIYVDGENGAGSSLSGSNEITTNTNNKSISEKFSYTISVELVDELKSIKIKEMSANDTVINTKEIIHKESDFEFKINEDTSYVIVEETCIDKDNKEITKRTIYDRDDIYSDEGVNHICNYGNDDGIVIPKYLYINK